MYRQTAQPSSQTCTSPKPSYDDTCTSSCNKRDEGASVTIWSVWQLTSNVLAEFSAVLAALIRTVPLGIHKYTVQYSIRMYVWAVSHAIRLSTHRLASLTTPVSLTRSSVCLPPPAPLLPTPLPPPGGPPGTSNRTSSVTYELEVGPFEVVKDETVAYRPAVQPDADAGWLPYHLPDHSHGCRHAIGRGA